jgi:TolB protein
MPAAGGEPVRLTNDPSDNFTPAWSPDGSRIVWSSNRGGSYQLYIMDATTGGNVVQLTTAGVNIQPAWSPDGSRIAWASGQGDDWDIWVMNADGSSKVNVTATTATNEAGPTWR